MNLLDNFNVNISKNPYSEIGHEKIPFCYGIYKITKDASGILDSMDNATIAYKIAKSRKICNYAFFDNEIRDKIFKERKIESTMVAALKHGEFVPYYQPKFDLSSNKMVGAEALVRWITPDKNVIPPIDFIPLFEKNGFVCELDYYMFEAVCKNIEKWLSCNILVVPISVNFSRLHLTDINFLNKLVYVINKYNIPPDLIEIELTESTFFENSDILLQIINDIKKIGFLISMDDFGSGYSSLNLLKDLPVDILKLDKDFLKIGLNTKRERIIIASIISMSKELEIKVISEGVETESQAEFLKDIGCDMVQGYLFSRPLPLIDFERLYMTNKIELNS